MGGLKDFIRKNLNPITHEVLRRNRVTETFIKEVIKDVKSIYFENGRKRIRYKHLPMPKIHSACRNDILSVIEEPTIVSAFIWDKTPQGYRFWENIDNQIILEAYDLR